MKSFFLILAAGAFLLLLSCFGCFILTFSVPRKPTLNSYSVMTGEQYDPLHDEMIRLIEAVVHEPCEDVFTTSFDGLKLRARYYAAAEGAPLEILVHGYRSNAIRDFSGGLRLALDSGHSVLLIDQRAHGKSEGRYLTFGIREKEDILSWIRFANEKIRPEKILLVGISMGASTVLMAAGEALPENVCGILADCGYTSPQEIIRKVIRTDYRLPAAPVWFLIRLGAKLFGGFDPAEGGTEEALQKARVPVLFIHGADDRFVPCEMSIRNYAACASEKMLLTVPDCGHGLAFLIDQEHYLEKKRELFRKAGIPVQEALRESRI